MIDRKDKPWNRESLPQDFETIAVETPVSGQFIIAIRRSCNNLRRAMEEILSTFITSKIAAFLPNTDQVADSIEHGASINACLVEGLKESLHVENRRSQPLHTGKQQVMRTLNLTLDLPKILIDAMRTLSAKSGTTLAEIITILIHDSFNYRIMTT